LCLSLLSFLSLHDALPIYYWLAGRFFSQDLPVARGLRGSGPLAGLGLCTRFERFCFGPCGCSSVCRSRSLLFFSACLASAAARIDRKSTPLNSSHEWTAYA